MKFFQKISIKRAYLGFILHPTDYHNGIHDADRMADCLSCLCWTSFSELGVRVPCGWIPASSHLFQSQKSGCRQPMYVEHGNRWKGGWPDHNTRSACFPSLMLPTRSSIRSSLAGLRVTVFNASSSLMPPYWMVLAAS